MKIDKIETLRDLSARSGKRSQNVLFFRLNSWLRVASSLFSESDVSMEPGVDFMKPFWPKFTDKT
jgi:hypothetical protein